jgi:DNA-binding transcriptional ArsR family regulator
VDVTDPLAIRALAHPLRLDLLDVLAAIGPATAAQCGRVLGVPQANCSFHLRQLAKYGFVEDAGPGDDRRERQWQIKEVRLRLRGSDAATAELGVVYVQRAMEEMLAHMRRAPSEDPDWRDKGGVIGGVGLLTAAEYEQVQQQIITLLEPYFTRAIGSGLRPEQGQRYIRYFMAGTPLAGFDSKESKDDSGPANSDDD